MKKILITISATITALILSAGTVAAQLKNPVVNSALGSGDEAAKDGTTFARYFTSDPLDRSP